MTVAQALALAAALGLERFDAQLLLLHALGRGHSERGWLLAHDRDLIDALAQASFNRLSQRRAMGEPLAYIVGRKEFYGLDLRVDPRVLIPRPDTETLVDWGLDVIKDVHAPRVLDLGTGSGAIALALKKQRQDARVEAVDQSAGALEVAAANARSLALEVTFRCASWLAGATGRFDLVLSNPPYIAGDDPHLSALSHEPVNALVAGAGGLAELRTLAGQAPPHLRPGGWLLLEHGHDQAGAVRGLLRAAGLQSVASRRDLSGTQRCSGGKWPEQG